MGRPAQESPPSRVSKRPWQERFGSLPDVLVVSLEADLETCLERNRRRANPIDKAAIHVIWHEFDEPDADVAIDVNERSPDEVVDRLLAALEAALEDE